MVGGRQFPRSLSTFDNAAEVFTDLGNGFAPNVFHHLETEERTNEGGEGVCSRRTIHYTTSRRSIDTDYILTSTPAIDRSLALR